MSFFRNKKLGPAVIKSCMTRTAVASPCQPAKHGNERESGLFPLERSALFGVFRRYAGEFASPHRLPDTVLARHLLHIERKKYII
jgi:hypothetical protein